MEMTVTVDTEETYFEDGSKTEPHRFSSRELVGAIAGETGVPPTRVVLRGKHDGKEVTIAILNDDLRRIIVRSAET